MGQVPARIMIVGDGRLAKTLWDVLHATDFPPPGASQATIRPAVQSVSRWSRKNHVSLALAVEESKATHIWLAITDQALESFIKENQPSFRNRTVVHFAGSLPTLHGVHAAHPLMTFDGQGPHTYVWFSKVPFALDLEGPELTELLPGFINDSFRLKPSARAYYHALCAAAGNFTVLLWETVGSRFQTELALPPGVLGAYRRQIFKNLDEATGRSVLTGPLLRDDTETLDSHRSALATHFEAPLLKIYDAFADLFRTERLKK